MKKTAFVLTFSLYIISANQIFSQAVQDTTFYQITTSDGNKFVGTIIRQDADTIYFNTDIFGQITIPKREIVRLEQLGHEYDLVRARQRWPANPHATRYFVGSNAYGLRRGEGYYQNAWVLFNQASVGVTDNISVDAGTLPLFLFAASVTPVWLTPRITIPVVENMLNLSGGALLMSFIGEADATFGMLTGKATLGSRDYNLSLGMAYGIVEGQVADRPFLSIGGMIRTGPKGYIITENYNFSFDEEFQWLISLGGRALIQNVALDYGVWVPIGDVRTIAIPWLSISIPFGI
jgi:hypothetical protein